MAEWVLLHKCLMNALIRHAYGVPPSPEIGGRLSLGFRQTIGGPRHFFNLSMSTYRMHIKAFPRFRGKVAERSEVG